MKKDESVVPSKDPEYLKRTSELHAWPGQANEEIYDNIDFEELIDEEPRGDWLIKKGKDNAKETRKRAKARSSKKAPDGQTS